MPRNVRILAIDDEEIILKSIRKALDINGDVQYTVTTATTALEGLQLVRGNTYDLIFVDLALSGMNGVEFLRRIKRTNPSISVIVMSGYSYERILLNEAADNADGLLSKPFTTGEIKSLISHILKAESKEHRT